VDLFDLVFKASETTLPPSQFFKYFSESYRELNIRKAKTSIKSNAFVNMRKVFTEDVNVGLNSIINYFFYLKKADYQEVFF
jgi:hypothetical protein